VPERRDGVRTQGHEGKDGQLGGGLVEASGSGGRDARRREYEEVLDCGGDGKDAYVDVNCDFANATQRYS
jgi:hypothetical protein